MVDSPNLSPDLSSVDHPRLTGRGYSTVGTLLAGLAKVFVDFDVGVLSLNVHYINTWEA